MANLIISDAIAEQLKQIAEKENKPVDVVLENMIEQYKLGSKLSGQHAVFTPFGGEDTARELMDYLNAKKAKTGR